MEREEKKPKALGALSLARSIDWTPGQAALALPLLAGDHPLALHARDPGGRTRPYARQAGAFPYLPLPRLIPLLLGAYALRLLCSCTVAACCCYPQSTGHRAQATGHCEYHAFPCLLEHL
ncbi:hypothetical protein GUJ93_ZPchr0001g30717 [Zizania palustris]|uniref:Uncharacterized protein n=1 Tax=Zizania palustris TaxID=103762 RepID=A0A8J5V258_ZIZPA|nr:hypothetical protein GUJ93_ZPchr0001g30717 [Zizania palustris]